MTEMAKSIGQQRGDPPGGQHPATAPASGREGEIASMVAEVGLTSVPSERDLFFIKAQWEALAKGPETLRQEGLRLIALATSMCGVYLAVLGLGDLAQDLPILLRVGTLVPFLP